MNKKKIGLAVTIVPVLAAGTVAMASAYKSGTDFKPFQNDQEIQTNQVVFDGDESGVDRKKKDDSKESSLLKDKQDDQRQNVFHIKCDLSWEFHTFSGIRLFEEILISPSKLRRTEQQVDKTSKWQQIVADNKVLQI